MKKIELLFDAIRSPADIANMIQLGMALDAKLYMTGNSIPHTNPKISGKLRSWHIQTDPNIEYNDSYHNMIETLRKQGRTLIGTSPRATKNFYDLDLSKINPVFVFGTETSGLSAEKQGHLDEMVFMPMSKNLDFMTLSVVVPAIAYDLHRQIREENERIIARIKQNMTTLKR